MLKPIILSTIMLTLSLFPYQLQASAFKFISPFRQPSPLPGLPGYHQEIYPPGTFPVFRAGEPAFWRHSLPLGNDLSLEHLFVPPLAALLPADCLPAPTLAQPAPKPNLSRRIINLALKHLHKPYRWGASLRYGRATDCSGLVRHVFGKIRIDLPHSSSQQARLGQVAAHSMDFSKLKTGDLLFFRQPQRRIGHVGIYLGEGKMIHASSRSRKVIITSLRQSYYTDKFVVAKRLLE